MYSDLFEQVLSTMSSVGFTFEPRGYDIIATRECEKTDDVINVVLKDYYSGVVYEISGSTPCNGESGMISYGQGNTFISKCLGG